MLSDRRVLRSSEALHDAGEYVGAYELSSLVYELDAPIYLYRDHKKVLDRKVWTARIVWDKNWPRVLIDGLEELKFGS